MTSERAAELLGGLEQAAQRLQAQRKEDWAFDAGLRDWVLDLPESDRRELSSALTAWLRPTKNSWRQGQVVNLAVALRDKQLLAKAIETERTDSTSEREFLSLDLVAAAREWPTKELVAFVAALARRFPDQSVSALVIRAAVTECYLGPEEERERCVSGLLDRARRHSTNVAESLAEIADAILCKRWPEIDRLYTPAELARVNKSAWHVVRALA